MKIVVLTFVLLNLAPLNLMGQNSSLYEKEFHISKKDTLPYRILYPKNFNPDNKYPLVLFLHGRGESGKDNESQLVHGSRLFLKEEFRENYPAIVVFPQCPKDSYWSNVNIQSDSTGKRHFNFIKGGKPTKAMSLVLSLLKELNQTSYVDKNRIYVGGLSMGGMGTYEILRRRTHFFAAAFAICGGDNIKNVEKYKNVPVWLFHGEKDDIVPYYHTVAIVKELENYKADYKYTLYPYANHNSWDSAFAEPKLLPWLFSHSRAGKK